MMSDYFNNSPILLIVDFVNLHKKWWKWFNMDITCITLCKGFFLSVSHNEHRSNL